VGITAGSREVPGRNACDRRHAYCIIIIINLIANRLLSSGSGYYAYHAYSKAFYLITEGSIKTLQQK